MISTGLPTSRLPRAQRWASERTTRPAPTAISANSHALTQSPWLGTSPLRSRPSIATVIAATDTALTTGATPSSTSARRRVRYSPRRYSRSMTSGAIASNGALEAETCSVSCAPPRASTTAAHSSTKSTVGRNRLQPDPSSSHCSDPPKLPPRSAFGPGASRATGRWPVSGSVVDVCWEMSGGSMARGTPIPQSLTRVLCLLALATTRLPVCSTPVPGAW